MRIDAHQHFWRYDAAEFAWIASHGPLARDHLPADLAPILEANGFDAAIAVQARQTVAETDWLLALAGEHDWLAGVVGWFDLADPGVSGHIAARRGQRLVGLRHLIQDEADDAFMLRPEIVRGIATCLDAGLTYDMLIYPRQAQYVPALLAQVAGGRFVLDHGAKPPIAAGGWQPWADDIAAIAAFPNVWCKVSGLVTEADHHAWRAAEIERYLIHLLACFGPDRLVFGSDWPVLTLAADYQRWVTVVQDFTARHCPAHVDAVFGGNALAAYELTP